MDDPVVGLEYCHMYATVREPSRPGAGDTPICASNKRRTLVFTSLTNSVIIQMSSHAVEDPSANFIITFRGTLATLSLLYPNKTDLLRDSFRIPKYQETTVPCYCVRRAWYCFISDHGNERRNCTMVFVPWYSCQQVCKFMLWKNHVCVPWLNHVLSLSCRTVDKINCGINATFFRSINLHNCRIGSSTEMGYFYFDIVYIPSNFPSQ